MVRKGYRYPFLKEVLYEKNIIKINKGGLLKIVTI